MHTVCLPMCMCMKVWTTLGGVNTFRFYFYLKPWLNSFPPFLSLPSFSLQAIEKARKKIMEAEQEMKLHTMSSKTDFLTTIYIGNKEGDSVGTTVQCLPCMHVCV